MDLEKRLLAKCLNYALPAIKLNYGNYMTPFELFSREIKKLLIEDHELEKVKKEIKKETYLLFDNYNFWNKLNISKEQFLALKGLSSNEDIILQKVDKGNLPTPDPKCKLIISSFLTLPHLLDCLICTMGTMSIVLLLQMMGGMG